MKFATALFLCVLSQVVGAQTPTLVKVTWVKVPSGFETIKPCDPPQPAGSNLMCTTKDYVDLPKCPDNAIGWFPPESRFDWKEYKESGGEVWCLIPPKSDEPLLFRHVQLPSIDPLPCQSKAVGLGIGFRPCEKPMPIIDFSSSSFPPDEHVCTGHWEGGSCHDGDGWTGAASGDFGPSVMQSGGSAAWNGTADGTYDAFNIPESADAPAIEAEPQGFPHCAPLEFFSTRWKAVTGDCAKFNGKTLLYTGTHWVNAEMDCCKPVPTIFRVQAPVVCVGDCGVERDVPAIQDRYIMHRKGEGWECGLNACFAPEDIYGFRPSCADKSRILLTAQDGTNHCIKF